MSDRSGPRPDVLLRDYQPPAWSIDAVELEFDLAPEATEVAARLALRRNPDAAEAALVLDAEAMDVLEIRIDGQLLADTAWSLADGRLAIDWHGERGWLQTRVRLAPERNTALEGLYLSGSRQAGFLLTQCEAEGFRRVTPFLDRPDVLSRYSVTLRADKARFPLLLANGNAEGAGDLPDGRHWARFVDPHPKPSYLFALVAGRLETLEDAFTTAEGRRVGLFIHAEADAIGRCGWAMQCLKQAMAWDEQRFGRCYDLDQFHVVATHDFTMGAMENKGLNVFNAKYLLADPDTATDDDYRHVLAVIGHEYFHNWSGNRVTCRDWFQLCLKEGLTVYREQEFESDRASRTLRRIEDVKTLWRAQFPEDAGPLAHAVRPDRYREINNFYTATVYEKGAEIVRMLAAALGREGFRRGLDLYFARHDGQAATVEQFLAALGDANREDLSAWLGWYAQAGTPTLRAEVRHDADRQVLELTLSQHTAPTPGQPDKAPVPIPVALALFDADGQPLRLQPEGTPGHAGDVVLLDRAEARFRFGGIARPPVVSLLRGYSAPVRLQQEIDVAGLARLVRHEPDGFNRWLAADALARRVFGEVLAGRAHAAELAAWTGSLGEVVGDGAADPALAAELLAIADAGSLSDGLADIDPDAVLAARRVLESGLAGALEGRLLARHGSLAGGDEAPDNLAAQGRRRLRNACLGLLCHADRRHLALARAQLDAAGTLTDRLAALAALLRHQAEGHVAALESFAARHAGEPLVLDKWLALEATAPLPATVERVDALTRHPAFRWSNPNKVHALLGSFATRNFGAFHRADGAGYRLVGEAILRLDGPTPQVAARLATAFGGWRRLEPGRRALMRAELDRLASGVRSTDTGDILHRALAG
jgi:aminopeptidase N